jgi:hypothetical protein
MCTPATPSGWFGPVEFFDQASGAPPAGTPACSGVYPSDAFDGYSTPTFAPASCSCSCGAAKAICTAPIVTVYSDNACGPNNCGTGAQTTCSVVVGPGCISGGQSTVVTTEPMATNSGWCDAAAEVTSTPPWSWSRTARGCRAQRTFEAGGCTAAQVCADKPASGFEPKLCVWTAQDLPDCKSAGGYSLIRKYYLSATDGRGCGLGGCQCKAPSGVGCALTGVSSYATKDCSGPLTSLDLTMSHCNYVGVGRIVSMIANVASTGSCVATGIPAHTGTVTPDVTTALTVCCAQ